MCFESGRLSHHGAVASIVRLLDDCLRLLCLCRYCVRITYSLQTTNHILRNTGAVASWQGGDRKNGNAPTKLIFCRKFFSNNAKCGAKLKAPTSRECKGKIEIVSIYNVLSCEKFAVVCRKIATSCPLLFQRTTALCKVSIYRNVYIIL